MNLKQYFQLNELIAAPLTKLKLSAEKLKAAIKALEELGYLHDSDSYMSQHEATALRRTGQVFATTNNGMLLWVTAVQLAELKKANLVECEEDK